MSDIHHSSLITHHSLRILLIHNRYRLPGGEDEVVAAQAKLLRARGHDVRICEKDNREIDSYGLLKKIDLFLKTADNPDAAAEIAAVAADFKPHVAHIHNTLPLLSPSIYAPLKKAGVKVIQHLHNYRLVCAAGTLFRDGEPCRLCLDEGLKHAVKLRCWNNSQLASLAVTRMQERHRRARTWHTQVDLFVALNKFQRDTFVKAGVIPADRVVVQPNFVEIDAPASTEAPGNGFVFAGRLTPEKGLDVLLRAHAQLNAVPLKIIGEGPQRIEPRANLELPGYVPRGTLLEHYRQMRALVFPSIWPEPFGLSIVEAMAFGKPVIAARVAGPAEIVEDGVTGLLYEPNDAAALANCMQRLHEDAELAQRLGHAGRERYEQAYAPEAGYQRLLENYARLNVHAGESR